MISQCWQGIQITNCVIARRQFLSPLIRAATSSISNLSPRLNLAAPNKTQPASIPPLAPGVIFDRAMAMAMA
jgi:hypothetical protein